MKLEKDRLKEFIKDYYSNMSYDRLREKYGLNKSQADRLWDNLMNKII